MKRWGFLLVTLLSLSVVTVLKAAPASLFDGKPEFARGEARSYYVWRDGNTWHLAGPRWARRISSPGQLWQKAGRSSHSSVWTWRRNVESLCRDARRHVVVGPRGRVRGVAGGRGPVVETRQQDHIDKEGDQRIVFNTLTNDDIVGFDFKVSDGVKVLRMALRIDGTPRPKEIQAGRNNAHVNSDPISIALTAS